MDKKEQGYVFGFLEAMEICHSLSLLEGNRKIADSIYMFKEEWKSFAQGSVHPIMKVAKLLKENQNAPKR